MPRHNRACVKAPGMAKSKRKPSAAQRDKSNIAVAKYLKKVGIISKQANLHGGHYISRGVLKKAEQYVDAAALKYGTVKVSKDLAQRAKERGFQVVQGNRIIGPRTPTFRNRAIAAKKAIKQGKEPNFFGVKPIKGGYWEEVELPHDIFDLHSLIAKGSIDSLKMPEEQFAFKFYCNESYRTFSNTQLLINELAKYKSINDLMQFVKPEEAAEAFKHLVIVRIRPGGTKAFAPSPDERERRRKQRMKEANIKRSYRRSKYTIDDLSKKEADRLRKKWAKRAATKRANMSPEKRAAYLEKQKEYSRKYRERNKKK